MLKFYFLVTLFYYRFTTNHKKSTFTTVFSCERESKILTSSNLTTIGKKMHELFIFSKCKALFYIIYNYYLLDYHFISAYLEEAIAFAFKTELSSGLHASRARDFRKISQLDYYGPSTPYLCWACAWFLIPFT